MLALVISTLITPNISVDSSTGELRDTIIICEDVVSCDLNFSTTRSDVTWEFLWETTSIQNPPSITFPFWKHQVSLMSWAISEHFSVEVLPKKWGSQTSAWNLETHDGWQKREAISPIWWDDYQQLIISEILPNPEWSDTEEYIDIYHTGSENVDINPCYLDDIEEGGSSPFYLENLAAWGTPTLLAAWTSIRIHNHTSRISLNNTGTDEARLVCEDTIISRLTYTDIHEWEQVYNSHLKLHTSTDTPWGQSSTKLVHTWEAHALIAWAEKDTEAEDDDTKNMIEKSWLLPINTDIYTYKDSRIRISWKEETIWSCLVTYNSWKIETYYPESTSWWFRCRWYPEELWTMQIELISPTSDTYSEQIRRERGYVIEKKTTYILSDFSTTPPSIELQGAENSKRFMSVSWSSPSITCTHDAPSCHINLKAHEEHDYVFREYAWSYPNWDIFETDNPPSVSFDRGKHTVVLTTLNEFTGATFTSEIIIQYEFPPEDTEIKEGKIEDEEEKKSLTHEINTKDNAVSNSEEEELMSVPISSSVSTKSPNRNVLYALITLIFVSLILWVTEHVFSRWFTKKKFV